MKKLVYIFVLMLILSLGSCVTVQQVARDFNSVKHNKVVVIIPPANSDIFQLYYPLDPYQHDIGDMTYDLRRSRFIQNFKDSIIIDLFMRGLTERLNDYGLRYIIPDSKELVLAKNEKAYMFSVAQMELLEYVDTVEIRSDSVFLTIPGERYARVFSADEVERLEFPELDEDNKKIDRVYYSYKFPRTNVVANTWLEFTELDKSVDPEEVLFSMQYTSDLIDGYFFIEYPNIEIKFSNQSYMIYINDVIDLIYFSGYKNGEYIADFLFNLYLAEQFGEKYEGEYFKYYPRTKRAWRTNNDKFIIMDP